MTVAEPRITVSGVQLSEGQAMAVRVALELFLMELPKLKDELGPAGQGYEDRLREVVRYMHEMPQ